MSSQEHFNRKGQEFAIRVDRAVTQQKRSAVFCQSSLIMKVNPFIVIDVWIGHLQNHVIP
jgi:hypothetical protein